MSEPAENVVHHAENIVAEERGRMVAAVTESLRQIQQSVTALAETAAGLLPQLERFASMLAEAEEWEAQQLIELEDDFWLGRGMEQR